MDAELFAGVAVSDLARARTWYDRFFGDVEAFDAGEDERVWTLGERRHVFAEVDPGRAGGGMVTLFVADLEAVLDAVAGRGLEPTSRTTYDNGVRKAVFHDPDGNVVGLGGAPSSRPAGHRRQNRRQG